MRLEEAGHCVRLHTHDEVLVECPHYNVKATRHDLRATMQRGFSWSEGLPLMSEETVAYYYSKSEEAHGL